MTVGKIYEKMAKVQAEVGAIEKNGKGPAAKGGFAFIKYEDVLDKIHALLVREGVILVPELSFYDNRVIEANNRQNIYSRVEAKYTFVATQDGSSVTVSSVGEGSDIGSDTATRKAATQAMKIAFLHTFTIPNTDDGILLDNEGHENVDRTPTQSPAKKPGAKTPTKSVDSNALGEAQNAVRKLVQEHPDSFSNPNAYITFGNRLHSTDKNWVNDPGKVASLHDALKSAIEKGEVIE